MPGRSTAHQFRVALAVLAVGCVSTVAAAPAPAAPAAKKPPVTAAAKLSSRPAAARGDTILAEVGGRVITAASFRKAWNRLMPTERPTAETPLAARKLFLEDLITSDMLGIEAMRHPRPLTPQQEADLRSARETLMKNELYMQEVYEAVRVDAVDMDLFRKEITRILYLRAFAFQNEQAAQAWYTRLAGGTPISRLETLARGEPAGGPRLVELGPKVRENFTDAVARVVYSLAPGRVSRPVAVSGEWWLYQVVSLRARPYSVDLNNQEAVLKEARRLLSEEAREAYRTSLGRELKLVYRMEAVDTLVNRFLLLPPRVTQQEGGAGVLNAYVPLPRLAPSDSALVLAATLEGEVTGRDLILFLADTPAIARPDVRSRDQLLPWIDRVAFDHELSRRAERLQLDRRPGVADELARKREGFEVQFLYEDSVSARVQAPEDSLRARFYADSTRFYVAESARIWACVVDRRSLADSVLQMARLGEDLSALARRYSIIEDAQRTGGVGPVVPRGGSSNQDLEDAIYGTPVGSFGGPVRTEEGWAVIKVVEKNPEVRRSYAQAHADLLAGFRRDEEERVLGGFLDRLHGRIPVVRHPERLPALVPAGSR